MKWYWISFSYNGKNQGCCNVQAKNKKEALQKTINLRIHPKHDNIMCVLIDNPELKPNKLYSRKKMITEGYISQKAI